MFREFKECLFELYDSFVEIVTGDRWATVTDQQAAEQIGIRPSRIDQLVIDGDLRVDRDGEIYQRSVDKYITNQNSY